MKKLLKRLFCPLVNALLQFIILCVVCYLFCQPKKQYHNSIANARIKTKIENRINECGQDYWLSWLVLDGNKYFFQDVIGCSANKKENCSFSVKDAKLNQFYNEENHKVDRKTYEFLNSIENGVSGYYNDLSFLKDFTSINEAIQNTNKQIYELGISVVKDKKRNLIYVFTMTNTAKENTKCNKNKITYILEDLSIYAKENL